MEALKRRRPRPQLDDADRAFWLAMKSAWRGWAARLILVQPDTVVRWHRDRFRRHWRTLSRNNPSPGRPRVDPEVRDLIRRLTVENDWGAPRIHGELTKHFNATFNPSATWVIQQLREAFPYDTAPRYLVFDRDSIFSKAVVGFVKSMGTEPHRTAYRCPWQNPLAERWIGGCRRELFDHVIVLSELHAVRLAHAYISYSHEDRTHLGLDKNTPLGRPVTPRPSSTAKVVARPRVGGLHNRYAWREAA